MKPVVYLFFRLGIGISMLGHGVVRVPKLPAFAEGMASQFEASLLPQALALGSGYLIPVAELILGILLTGGWLVRQAALAGGILMLLLMAGTSLVENWAALPSQMIHLAFFAILLQFAPLRAEEAAGGHARK